MMADWVLGFILCSIGLAVAACLWGIAVGIWRQVWEEWKGK